jgi:hypothetical protein
LQDAGFKLGNVSVAAAATPPTADITNPAASVGPTTPVPQPTPASIIVSQIPAAGQKVAAGTPVSFEVR